ncbi:hypothetical protein [Streptomyces sp. NBC_01429]|uniref:hypothetical protein n=1 Tax=Streptomyces sp. NBC_01429 TaxID=2903862 RepID=UPI002E2BA271|nr:hypothetical protein [Streptomyces sp. NBC_01429]
MYEPNDVTVELDGLGRQLSELPAGSRPAGLAAAVPEAGPEGSDGPVFVDESGRRSRKLRKAGWFVAVACACYAVTVVAALVGGNSDAPWLPIPGLAEKGKADSVEIRPGVTASGSVPASPGAPGEGTSAPDPDSDDPAAVPRTPGRTAPSGAGDADAPAPGASGTAGPAPAGAATRTQPAPGVPSATATAVTGGTSGGAAGTGGGDGQPSQSTQPSEPEPTPSDPATSADPQPGLDGGGQDLAAAEGAR